MELAIIAAGTGSRLKQEGIDVSKPLVRINKIPLIKRLITSAVNNGITKVNCIINEESPDLKKYLLLNDFNCEIELKIKSTPSSLHSFMEISSLVKGDKFLLATADSVFIEHEFNNFINYSKSKKDISGVLAVTSFVDDEKPLYVKTNNNIITRFADNNCENCLVTGGLYYFDKKVLNEISTAVLQNMNHLRNYFRLLLEKDHILEAYEFSKIIDVDHIEDIKTAEEFLSIELK